MYQTGHSTGTVYIWEEGDLAQHAADVNLLEQPKHIDGIRGSQAYRTWPMSP